MNLDKVKIMVRAYQLSQERVGNGNAPLDDWLKAEWEIKNGLVEEIKDEASYLTHHAFS
jgi:hypothetical protein